MVCHANKIDLPQQVLLLFFHKVNEAWHKLPPSNRQRSYVAFTANGPPSGPPWWIGHDLPPQEWGWKPERDTLVPIRTEDPPPPEILLKTIFFQSAQDCVSEKCGCRKAMLNCSVECLHCKGQSSNIVPGTKDDVVEALLQGQLSTMDDTVKDNEHLPGPSCPKKLKHLYFQIKIDSFM